MGYAEHEGNGPDATVALPGFGRTSADRVRYADSGGFPGSGRVADSGRTASREALQGGGDGGDGDTESDQLPDGGPADDGLGSQAGAGWSPDMATGAYPVIRS
jgi:hypothetical protein